MSTTFHPTLVYRRDPVTEASPAAAIDRIAFAALCAFVFTVPWEESAPLVGGFVVGWWVGLAVVAAVAMRVLVTGQYRKVSSLQGWMSGLVAWAALSIIWSVNRESTISRVGTYVQLLTVAWLIWELAVTETRVEKLLQSYVFGTGVLSVSTLVNYYIGYTAADASADLGIARWQDSRYTVFGINENDLGLMLALSIPMTFYLLARRRSAIVTILLWAQLGMGFTALFLTGSRGGMVSALVALTIFPLVASRLPRSQRIVAAAVCVAGLAAGAYLVPQVTWTRLMGFTSEISEGTLTHRTVIWAAGLDAFRDHPLAGVGAGAYGTAVARAVDISYVAHNTFLSVLVELGIVGALLFLALLASLWYAVSRMRNLERHLWIVLLLTWTTGVSALTWEYHKPTWLLFGLAAAHVYSRRDRISREAA